MRAMTNGIVGATPRGRPRECEAVPPVYPQPRTRKGVEPTSNSNCLLLRGTRRVRRCRVHETVEPLPRPYVGLVLCGLLACGPGSVAPPTDDDAQGDDDASVGDDDLAGDDDAATGGTGTISVTMEVLAVLAEGQTVEAEIVVDGEATGVFPPAEIEVEAGEHTVTLKTNDPNAPVPERFVAAPHEVSVIRNGTVACPMFVGRDLGGTWRMVEENGEPPCCGDGNPFEVRVDFIGDTAADPCATGVWMEGWRGSGLGILCLLTEDRVWYQLTNPDPEYTLTAEGTILDSGARVEYIYTAAEEGWPTGPFVFARQE